LKTKMLSSGKIFHHPVLLLLLYFLITGILLYTIDYCPKAAIERMLIKGLPWVLLANAALILIGIVFCRQEIAAFFQKLFVLPPRKINYQGILLVLVVVFALVMASFVAPRTHRIYFDEDIYAHIGQNIALTHQAAASNYGEFVHGEYQPDWLAYNKEPGGWPFLISLAFQIFGVDEAHAFTLNNILLAAGAGLVFMLALQITGSFPPAILAALIYSLIPHNLLWANTAAAEPAAAFFALACLLGLAVYLKTQQWRHLYLLAVLLPFAGQMRPESVLIVPLSLLAIVLIRPGSLQSRPFWGAGLITYILLAPLLIHFYAVSGQSWGAEGAKFSLAFFQNNISANGWYYLNNVKFPVLFTLFALLGLFFSRYSARWKIILFLWFAIFWGIFLFFYAGSYRYGADVRFAVVSFAPLAILAGLGVEWMKNRLQPIVSGTNATIILVLILLFSWIQFLPMIRLVGQEAWEARADHRLTREFVKNIPGRAIVVSHIPSMLLLWGKSAVSVNGSLNNPDFMRNLIRKHEGEVYFHHNYWCHALLESKTGVLRELKQNYDLEEIAADSSTGRLFGLYRIRIKEGKEKGGQDFSLRSK